MVDIGGKVAIVGEEDIVICFKAFGFNVFAVNRKDNLADVIENIVKENILVCLVQENFCKDLDFSKYKTIFIPFKNNAVIDLSNFIKSLKLKAIGKN